MIENDEEIDVEEFKKIKAATNKTTGSSTHRNCATEMMLSPPDNLRLEPTDLLILVMEKALDPEKGALQIWEARARKRSHEHHMDNCSSSEHVNNDLNTFLATMTTSETTATAAATEQSLLTVDATSDSDDNDSLEMDDQSYAALCLSAAAAGHDLPMRPPPSPMRTSVVQQANSLSTFKAPSILPVASSSRTVQHNTLVPPPTSPPLWEVAVVGWRSDPISMVSLLVNLAAVLPDGASIACVSVQSITQVREPALAVAGFASDGSARVEPFHEDATNLSTSNSSTNTIGLPQGVRLRHVLVASETNEDDLRRALLTTPTSKRSNASPLRGVLVLSCESAQGVHSPTGKFGNSFDSHKLTVDGSNKSSNTKWEESDKIKRGSWTNNERSCAGGTTALGDAAALAGALATDIAINGALSKESAIPVPISLLRAPTEP